MLEIIVQAKKCFLNLRFLYLLHTTIFFVVVVFAACPVWNPSAFLSSEVCSAISANNCKGEMKSVSRSIRFFGTLCFIQHLDFVEYAPFYDGRMASGYIVLIFVPLISLFLNRKHIGCVVFLKQGIACISCLMHWNLTQLSVISCPNASQTVSVRNLRSTAGFPTRFISTISGTRDALYPISFRVVRFAVKEGLYETVITNLPADRFPSSLLRELYHKRWGIETPFRDLKYTLALTLFHAQKRPFIKQEIFSRMTLYNLLPCFVYMPFLRSRRANISTALTPLSPLTLHGNS